MLEEASVMVSCLFQPNTPFLSCFGGRRSFASPETCLLTLDHPQGDILTLKSTRHESQRAIRRPYRRCIRRTTRNGDWRILS